MAIHTAISPSVAIPCSHYSDVLAEAIPHSEHVESPVAGVLDGDVADVEVSDLGPVVRRGRINPLIGDWIGQRRITHLRRWSRSYDTARRSGKRRRRACRPDH